MSFGEMSVKRIMATALTLAATGAVTAADEPAAGQSAGAAAAVADGQVGSRVEVRIEESQTKSSEDGEKSPPRVTRRSRIVIVGPDGVRREFDGEDKEGRSMILQIPDGEALLKQLESGAGAEAAEEEPERLMIGVRCEAADVRLKKHLKLPEAGLVVLRVEEGTPAAKAGIEVDDIILSVNGQNVATPVELVEKIGQSEGRPVELSMLHNGEQKTLSVTPEKMKPAAFPAWEDESVEVQGLPQMRQGRGLLQMHPGIMLDLKPGSAATPEEIERQMEQMRDLAEAVRGRANRGSEVPASDRDELQQLTREVRELKELVEKLQPKRE
ncbi:MAG: PDZ domain-containing protein [Planctomyces sp.]